ncbi:MAG: hypothetical protein V3S01_07070 [Dehalococcoidia bacterium]
MIEPVKRKPLLIPPIVPANRVHNPQPSTERGRRRRARKDAEKGNA